MKPDFFNQARGYTNHGSLLEFVLNTKYLRVEAPRDYSAEEAGSIVEDALPGDVPAAATTVEETLPNIICIMDETLSDLSMVGDFETNEDYMPFLRSLTENTVRGYVYVPTYGAGTANSEFEFLTGDSMSFLPLGACAYEAYVKGTLPSLVSSLGSLGYEKIALHPYYGDNWNRDTVYPYMGFERFLDIHDLLGENLVDEYRADKNFGKYYRAVSEEFPDETVFLRRYVSDSFDFKNVISLFEENQAAGDKPLFLFNVTMQNHSGYEYTYSNFDQEIWLTGDMEGKYPKVDQYLSLIKRTDEAVADLLDYFSAVDEPTIICVFGDHQPSVEQEFYEELYGERLNDLPVEEEVKMYLTPFYIWANYDIEEAEVEDISLNYLSTVLLQTAGLPMTPYQSYLSALHEKLPVITTVGYMDTEGNWYATDEDAEGYDELRSGYRKVQYNQLFDRQNRVDELFTLNNITLN
jgi:phosphoglycerol transferase MdoB-like AlkP superfamily enzyme